VKYLITGATGFLGPYLLKKLVSQGHGCRCLVRSSSHLDHLKVPGVEFVYGDVTKPDTLKGIAQDMDALVHMATLGHMSNFSVTQEMFDQVNVQGTFNIMQEGLRAGVGQVVHCSTVAAMGISKAVPSNEESVCYPHHPYGRSKLKAEQQIKRMVSEKGLPASIIRFSMIYGPGDPRDILKLVRMAKKGLFPKVGQRPKLTPLIHAEDAVEGLLAVIERGRAGEVYLITNHQSEPFDKIREIVQDALKMKKFYLYVPEWAALLAASLIEKFFGLFGKTPPVSRKNIQSTLADRVFSVTKAEKELGFRSKIEPEQGLKETVEWYVDKGWV
jgi:dihydroflavonol-4-reductase